MKLSSDFLSASHSIIYLFPFLLSCFLSGCMLSSVQFFMMPWTLACQPRIFQERILKQVAFPTPGNLSYPGMENISFVSPALAGRLFTAAPPRKPILAYY